MKTIEIVDGNSKPLGYACQMGSGLRQVTWYAVSRPTNFAEFLLHSDEWKSSEMVNQDERLHENSPAGIRSWAATMLGKPASLFLVDRRFKSVWPASPFIASKWHQYSLSHSAGTSAVMFRAVEARNLTWARRLSSLPGGQSQRISELYAVRSQSTDGTIVPFPLYVGTAGTGTLTEKYDGGVGEPSWATATSALDAIALTYAVQTRWVEMIESTPAPAFVGGVIETSGEWEDAAAPFDGLAPVGVSLLQVINDSSTQDLLLRFGPGTDTVATIPAGGTFDAEIPAGRTYTFTRYTRPQLQSAASEPYRIRFKLARTR